jgi:hypothetical protein
MIRVEVLRNIRYRYAADHDVKENKKRRTSMLSQQPSAFSGEVHFGTGILIAEGEQLEIWLRFP